MAKISKRMKSIKSEVEHGKVYAVTEALQKLKDVSAVKFDESVDISINLGLDPRKSVVRASTVLPNGIGKTVRVAVFAQGDKAEAAKKAGADVVGGDELAAAMKGGDLAYDVVIATPDSMRIVGQLGQILGPRGLMPNPKVGTVTPDVAAAVENAKSGQVRFRMDKGGIVHCMIGKLNFSVEKLRENAEALLADIKKAKPSAAKGTYIKKIVLSSTMGPGIRVDIATIS